MADIGNTTVYPTVVEPLLLIGTDELGRTRTAEGAGSNTQASQVYWASLAYAVPNVQIERTFQNTLEHTLAITRTEIGAITQITIESETYSFGQTNTAFEVFNLNPNQSNYLTTACFAGGTIVISIHDPNEVPTLDEFNSIQVKITLFPPTES